MGGINVCRLETFAVVATFLHVSDRGAEQGGAVLLSNGEQGDFAVEFDKFFNDKLADIATASAASVFPGVFKFVGTLHQRLSFTGG